MKNKYTSLLLLVTILLSLNCEYKFAEDYYHDIEIGEPTFSLSLLNFNEGDILRSPKTIEYDYKAPSRNSLYEIRFYIDGDFEKVYTEPTGHFFIDIENLSNGEHTLTVEYFFKTSSGSLAEISGQEYFVEIEEFSFEVDKTTAVLEIEKVEHKDQSIYIYFKDYPLIDEIDKSIHAKLLIYNEFDRLPGELTLTKEIIESGVINDNISLDLNLGYTTKIENDYGAVESEMKEITIPDTFRITASATEDGEFKFNWTPHPLRNNIKSALLIYDIYAFRKQVGINLDNSELIYDDIFGNFNFGRKYYYRLELTANDNSLSYYQTPRRRLEGEFFRGEEFEVNNYKKFLYNKITDKLYAFSINDNGAIYIDELNATSLNLVKRSFITNSNNAIGDCTLSANKNFIIDLNSKSLEVDSNSFQIVAEHTISEFDNSALQTNTIVRFRENTFVIDKDGNSKDIAIYDIPSKSLILKQYYTNSNSFNISADGKYFNVGTKIYQINITTTAEIYSDEFNRNLHTDYETSINKVFLAAGYVREVDLLNSSINQIPNLSNISRVEYLPSQHKILALHPGYYLSFHDLNTKETIWKIIEIENNSYFYLAEKNYLISPYGFVLKNFQ